MDADNSLYGRGAFLYSVEGVSSGMLERQEKQM